MKLQFVRELSDFQTTDTCLSSVVHLNVLLTARKAEKNVRLLI